MSENIPALIAEARRAQVAVYIAAPEPVAEDLHRIIKSLADALESPSGDDALPERLEAQATFVPETRMADVMREAAMALRAARRLSPLTQEALIESLKVAMLGTTDGDFLDGDDPIPAGEMFRLAAEWVEDNLSRFSLPEPADDEWEYALSDGTYGPTTPTSNAVSFELTTIPGFNVLRRVKAGEWLPVEEGTK